MITGSIKSQIDQIWNTFWSGGIANPLEVMIPCVSGNTYGGAERMVRAGQSAGQPNLVTER